MKFHENAHIPIGVNCKEHVGTYYNENVSCIVYTIFKC